METGEGGNGATRPMTTSTTPEAILPAAYRGHRWFEQQTGRYTRQDPLGLSGGINVFTYVNANPIRYSDPLGLDNVGCDSVPGAVESPCVLECCAAHDKCYDNFKCGSESWLHPEKSCHPSDCSSCNATVESCVRRCTFVFWDRHDRQNFYCAAQHRFVTIPGDFATRRDAEAVCEHDHSKDCCGGKEGPK